MAVCSMCSICPIFKSFLSDNHNNNERNPQSACRVKYGALICPRSSAAQPQSLIPRKRHINSLASKSDQSRRSIIHSGMRNFNKPCCNHDSIPFFFSFYLYLPALESLFLCVSVSFLSCCCSLHLPFFAALSQTPSFTCFFALLVSLAFFTPIPFNRETLVQVDGWNLWL